MDLSKIDVIHPLSKKKIPLLSKQGLNLVRNYIRKNPMRLQRIQKGGCFKWLTSLFESPEETPLEQTLLEEQSNETPTESNETETSERVSYYLYSLVDNSYINFINYRDEEGDLIDKRVMRGEKTTIDDLDPSQIQLIVNYLREHYSNPEFAIEVNDDLSLGDSYGFTINSNGNFDEMIAFKVGESKISLEEILGMSEEQLEQLQRPSDEFPLGLIINSEDIEEEPEEEETDISELYIGGLSVIFSREE